MDYRINQLLAARDSVDSLLLGLAVTDISALTDELHATVHTAELLDCAVHLSPTMSIDPDRSVGTIIMCT